MIKARGMATAVLLLAASAAGAPVAAQHDHAGGHGMASAEGVPEGWLMRFDRASASADMASFRTMEPGWHLTTGRAGSGIYWQPAMTASGEYEASARIHLMKPAGHPEAFGIFVGGDELDAADQSYLYFLVRQTGEYLIKRRQGDETETVVGWTAHDAIPTAATDESTAYDLTVDVGAETVSFQVNGVNVHTLPKSEVQTDGVVGIRVNHMLDVHVERLEVDGA